MDAAGLIARLHHSVRSERSERRQTSPEPADDRSRAEPIARMELFTTILARARMPCDYRSSVRGTPLAIRRVIAATDDDVAGQAIFKSVIEYADEERRRAGQEPIPTAALARLSSHGLTRAELIRAIGTETSYPQGMALAGKARSVFDYLYGQVLRELSLDRRRRPPVGLGRVIWLGLEALIDEEDALQHNPRRGHLNLIFQGLPTGDDLTRRIAGKDYMLVHCTTRRTRVSTSRFIELCRARHAGTHTTRFKLAERLSHKNLVTVDGPYVLSTSFGRAVLQAYKMFFNEPRIGLHPLDQDLRNTLETLSAASTTEEATPVFDAYLQRVIVALGEYVGWLRDHRERHDAVATIADLRVGAAQRSRRRRRERSSGADEAEPAVPQHEAKTATVTLVGDGAMLAREHVEAMRSNPNDFDRICRSEGPLSQDRTMTMRNLLRIPLDASLQAVDVFQPSLRERIDPSFCTVMRAPVELIDLHGVLDLHGALDCHVVSLASDDLPPSETTASAHEPLYVSDLRRPEINNPEKLRLIREYLAPWRINDALVTARSAGDPIPDTVLMRTALGSELRFERVDWVEKGRVHNFESMLAIMENKYMSPPARTEALMEDLYLS